MIHSVAKLKYLVFSFLIKFNKKHYMNPFTLFVIRIRAINSHNFLSIPLKKPTKRTLSFNRRTLNLRAPFINFFRSIHRSKIFHSNVELNCKQKKFKKKEKERKNMKNQKNKKKVKKSNNMFAHSFTMKRGTALYQYIVLSLHMSALLTSCKHETFRRCVFKQYRRTKTIQLVRSYAEQLKLLARFSRQFRAYKCSPILFGKNRCLSKNSRQWTWR